ncbi:MAG: glycosyltransferase family 39 protein [Actinomycetota bacterium]
MNADPSPRLDPAPSVRRARVARAVVVAAIALLLVAALTLLGGSFASYATVKHRLDAFASDHDASLSRSRFDAIVWQLRGAALVLLALAVAVHVGRRRVTSRLDAVLGWALADSRAARTALRRWLRSESRLHLYSLAAISVTAVVVRIDFLFQPMRYDEAVTYVHYASRPVYIGLTAYTAPNNHILHTLLVHMSTAVFGNEPWAIRLPALVAGVLLVPATYLVTRIIYGGAPALVAAALVATSSTLVEYSTNARGYTLLGLITLLLLALATRFRADSSPAAWTAFTVLGALGLWTIPTMAYALGTIVAWLVITIITERRHVALLRTRLLPSLLGMAALTLVLYAPVLATAGPHALTQNPFVAPRTWSYVGHHLPASFASTFARWHRDQPLVLWTLLAAGFVISLAARKRLSRFHVPVAVGALVAIPPLLAVQRVVPFERVWLFALPIYLMSAAAGLLYIVRRLPRLQHFETVVALVAVALCASLAGEAVASRAVYRSEDTSTFRDAPAVSAFLQHVLRPGDRVLSAPPADQILEYYLDRAGLDAGRLLYTDFQARRLFAVVKLGPNEYPLPVVIRQHLDRRESAGLRPVVVRRFSHAIVYRLPAS